MQKQLVDKSLCQAAGAGYLIAPISDKSDFRRSAVAMALIRPHEKGGGAALLSDAARPLRKGAASRLQLPTAVARSPKA